MRSQLREANKHDIRHVLIVGEAELADQMVAVKPMDGGDQVRVPRSEVVSYLRQQVARPE